MITKSASIQDNYHIQSYFLNSAREGWKLVLEGLDRTAHILLPSYIGVTNREGSGIFDPVTTVRVKYDFYMLNTDLSISIDELNKCISVRKYDLILLVHYFGFEITNISEIVSLCKKHHIIVVEDCAHLFNITTPSLSPAGRYGDFAFYSLHKYFPVQTGGVLIANTPGLLKIDNSNIDLNSTYANIILKYDGLAISQTRRNNYIILSKLLATIPGVRSLKTMKSNDIPHSYPVLIENGLREKLYFWLIDKDIPLTALYYRLIPPLQNQKYQAMLTISASILNIPTHQDMNQINLAHIVENMSMGISELST
jgi:dTDP-4-amino-4,6-dideoxygalactose transaminase